ncbi:YcjX family protein [Oceanospirillum linum]|uniref:ATPase n=1 Tax=Oceanospirillum linum TaxID=966 RepID=A0A1T1HC77_OCELI|nr:YcjX family protein [Oceanospirillum linum]OOV87449.1 hypothetical protein BTA35_0205215 [Oceanospirillum linum]SEF88081.1 hypothetical protein SAMN04489856_1035 [Oleiphilus messinensis]SMP13879.1 hypothetical protein SAMN06264348_102535 [Oceanospirillum linum]
MVKRYLKSAGKQLGSKIGKQLGKKVGQKLIRQAENLNLQKRHRMGVTGFSRAGKTVLITQMTHSLLRVDEPLPEGVSRHPLSGLDLFDAGLLKPARLKEDQLARRSQFDFFRHRDSLMGQGRWPEPTRDLTWLELEIKRPQKPQALQQLVSADNLQLEIMDYPGEWLADLALPEQSFRQWSESAWELAQQPHRRKLSEPFCQLISEAAEQQQVSDALERKLADAWKDYLTAARAEGYVLNQPSRVLVPGQMQNYAMLGFFPVPDHLQLPKLQNSMARLFDAYKQEIESYLGRHFRHLDSQIILVDLLTALEQGEAALNELQQAMQAALRFFRYGNQKGMFQWLNRKIGRVVFAATKADQLVLSERIRLEKLLGALLNEIDPGNDVRARADVRYRAIAALETTRSLVDDHGQEYLLGRETDGRQQPYYSGRVPEALPIDWQTLPEQLQLKRWSPPVRIANVNQLLPAYQLGRVLNDLLKDDLS